MKDMPRKVAIATTTMLFFNEEKNRIHFRCYFVLQMRADEIRSIHHLGQLKDFKTYTILDCLFDLENIDFLDIA